jgi:hypothetical protein
LLLLIELGLCFVAVLLALAFPRLGDRWFTAIERHVSRFAARRRLAVLTIFLLALGARLAVLPIEPIPVPGIHDEFSYLLMADTFAHGRLTNPPHPMWKHFETFHVIWQPTYCSKYFPAPGVFLAFGQIILGHPFWGVWLSTGLMCAAFCWALQGWMPPAWAFLAGTLVVLRLGIFSYWANSYWGGSVAAIGGALVLGALPRIKRTQRIGDALAMAVGFAILANSRPYEGLIYSTPILIALALWLFRGSKAPIPYVLRSVVAPIAVVLVVTCIAMGYYFWKTTGNPFQTPYAVYSARYDGVPPFPWPRIRAVPAYNHSVMENFYSGYVMQQYTSARNAIFETALTKLLSFWLFFVGPALTIPFFAALWMLPYGFGIKNLGPKVRMLLLINLVSFASLLLVTYFNLHYAAPMVCAWYALLLLCVRRVWISNRHASGSGKSIVRGVVMLCLATAAVKICATDFSWSHELLFDGSFPTAEQAARAPIVAKLRQLAGQHLVLVHYKPNHNPHVEWVYNSADINGSKIVWAREMDSATDGELREYFKNRDVWLLLADEVPPRLQRYTEIESSRTIK